MNKTIKILLSVLFLISAVICNSAMDILDQSYSHSFASEWNEQFWNPAISVNNKWKDGDREKGEKFLFSSTVLVWLTDGWHLLKALMILFLVLSFAVWIKGKFYKKIFVIIGGAALWGFVFEIFHSKILRKRNV